MPTSLSCYVTALLAKAKGLKAHTTRFGVGSLDLDKESVSSTVWFRFA